MAVNDIKDTADSELDDDDDFPSTHALDNRILKNVIAYVEVQTQNDNRSKAISKELEKLGATVTKKFTSDVTHIIFKEGSTKTKNRALKLGLPLLSVLWVDSCKKNQEHVSEKLFPAIQPEENGKPDFIGKPKKLKSMLPKEFSEEVADSSERCNRRWRRVATKKLKPEESSHSFIDALYVPNYLPSTISISDFSPVSLPLLPTPSIKQTMMELKQSRLQSPTALVVPDSPVSDLHHENISENENGVNKTQILSALILPAENRSPVGEVKKSCGLSTRTSGSTSSSRSDQAELLVDEHVPISSAYLKTPKTHLSNKLFSHSKFHVYSGENPDLLGISDTKAFVKKNSAECVKEMSIPGSGKPRRTNLRLTIRKLFNKNGFGRRSKVVTGEILLGNCEETKEVSAKANLKETLDASCMEMQRDAIKCGDEEHDYPFDASLSTGKIMNEKECSPKDLLIRKKRNLTIFRRKLKSKHVTLRRCRKNKVHGEMKCMKSACESKNPLLETCGLTAADSNSLDKANVNANAKDAISLMTSQSFKSSPRTGNETSESDRFSLTQAMDVCNSLCFSDASSLGRLWIEELQLREQVIKKLKKKSTKSLQSVALLEEPEKECLSKALSIASMRSCGGNSTQFSCKRSIKKYLVMSSLHSFEQEIIMSVVKKLGGCEISDKVSCKTTHVVCGQPRRTLNVLFALVQGCWLLSKEWVLGSLEFGCWQEEEKFELTESFPAARLVRSERQKYGCQYRQSLFQNIGCIFISNKSSAPKKDVAMLVKLCGGSVTSLIAKAKICIGEEFHPCLLSISPLWVFDSIAAHSTLPFDNYLVEKPKAVSPEY